MVASFIYFSARDPVELPYALMPLINKKEQCLPEVIHKILDYRKSRPIKLQISSIELLMNVALLCLQGEIKLRKFKLFTEKIQTVFVGDSRLGLGVASYSDCGSTSGRWRYVLKK